jgi:hypothetical protein
MKPIWILTVASFALAVPAISPAYQVSTTLASTTPGSSTRGMQIRSQILRDGRSRGSHLSR